MGLFDGLRKQVSNFGSQLQNGGVADAAMAACALITLADGEKELQEVQTTKQFIVKYDKFDGLDRRALAAKYENYCEQASDMFDRLDLLELLRKLRNRPTEARTVVQVAVLVSNSDGDFEDEEKAVVREICGILNLDPSEFGA